MEAAASLLDHDVDRPLKYVPFAPSAKQWEFLRSPAQELLYGGAAGGGKSAALLMAALQHVDHPRWSALLLRRSYAQLTLEGALMDLAADWLANSDARWSSQEKTWRFPSGATITFGYLETEVDKYRYQGAQFTFVGFDELTQFNESQYRYLFSRLRKSPDAPFDLRIRATSNPGGSGHDWVKQRFLVEGPSHGRVYIPAKLWENPGLDHESYVASLGELDPVTKEQLLNGDWSARQAGGYLRREWFEVISREIWDAIRADSHRVRYWDLAATKVGVNKDPDWTAGALLGRNYGSDEVVIADLQRMRDAPGLVEKRLVQVAEMDGQGTEIYIEQEPGSAGKTVIEHYIKLLANRAVRGDQVTGPKIERAKLLSAKAAAGKIKVVEGLWLGDFFDECDAFPMGSHDDQVDAVSGALARLFGGSYDTAIAYFERSATPQSQKAADDYLEYINGPAVDDYLKSLQGDA